MRKLYALFFLAVVGCSRSTPVLVKTELVNNGITLKITGPDSTILNDIARGDSTGLQALFPVYSMPADTDMKDFQDQQPGKYLLKNGGVFFTPDTPFKHQQTYFLRYYDYALSGNVWEFIKTNNHKGKPPHADYTFTP
ncbi:hypothetical protein [Mucilaginibacter auburnensis]|uniref:Lipoprotein n=1 Tax=Mucilaginibacter auburnensis TaxID=1457233 RepID=A0A2H9VS97_9SPHI|nr:hypothetical protein [Mucilaginibacter auburnensis]PJJ83690.1 hypothetical protein CLV57_0683 [Mucilaginibacter auburnensis]